MTTIHIEIKSNYGQDAIYIISEPHKSAIAWLTGKKTIDKRDIEALKKLGFAVVEPARPGIMY